jgi:UDP-N-acetylglucosamine:LPS N-acetylglucosamine transferase
VAGAFEQTLNALYLEGLGYGTMADMSKLTPELFADL